MRLLQMAECPLYIPVQTRTLSLRRRSIGASAEVRIRRCADVQMCEYADVQMCRSANMQMCRHADLQKCKKMMRVHERSGCLYWFELTCAIKLMQ